MESKAKRRPNVSRKRDIGEMANLIGNSAAHAALYPDQEFMEKEVVVYMRLASEVAAGRTWNDLEIGEFREKARRRAESEIKRRIKEEGLNRRAFKDFMATAESYINEFIESEMRQRR